MIVGRAGTETQENGVLALILRILLQGLGPPHLPSGPQGSHLCKGSTGPDGPMTFLSAPTLPFSFSASDTWWKSVAILVSYLHFGILPPKAQRTNNSLGIICNDGK